MQEKELSTVAKDALRSVATYATLCKGTMGLTETMALGELQEELTGGKAVQPELYAAEVPVLQLNLLLSRDVSTGEDANVIEQESIVLECTANRASLNAASLPDVVESSQVQKAVKPATQFEIRFTAEDDEKHPQKPAGGQKATKPNVKQPNKALRTPTILLADQPMSILSSDHSPQHRDGTQDASSSDSHPPLLRKIPVVKDKLLKNKAAKFFPEDVPSPAPPVSYQALDFVQKQPIQNADMAFNPRVGSQLDPGVKAARKRQWDDTQPPKNLSGLIRSVELDLPEKERIEIKCRHERIRIFDIQ